MIKKLAPAVVVALIAASQAGATVSIDWSTANGIDDPNVPGTGFDLPTGSLAQLIWTPTGVIAPIDNLDPTTPQGSEILLDSFFTSLTGGWFQPTASYMGENYGQAADFFVGGFAYTRVFNSGTPTAGTLYGEGGLTTALLDRDPPNTNPPETSDISSAGLFTLNQAVVPEPSTWAFMGIGLISALAWRRRR
jgi:hypothetical protein